jgi:hypothetical protein
MVVKINLLFNKKKQIPNMPKCKNGHGTYKGTEPSPKGLGYCAKHEKVNSKKFGLNGYVWIVKQTKKGIKRWIPLPSSKPQKRKIKDLPLNIRLIIGYHYDRPENPKKHTTKLTKKQIHDLIKQKIVWQIANSAIHEVGITQYKKGNNEYSVYPYFTPKNISKIQVQEPPKHNPTFWEKLTQKYKSKIYHPDYVVIVDLKNIQLKQNTWNTCPTIPINDAFLYSLKLTLNHHFYAANGWISDLKEGSSMEIVQIEWLNLAENPDYRKFDIGWW